MPVYTTFKKLRKATAWDAARAAAWAAAREKQKQHFKIIFNANFDD